MNGRYSEINDLERHGIKAVHSLLLLLSSLQHIFFNRVYMYMYICNSFCTSFCGSFGLSYKGTTGSTRNGWTGDVTRSLYVDVLRIPNNLVSNLWRLVYSLEPDQSTHTVFNLSSLSCLNLLNTIYLDLSWRFKVEPIKKRTQFTLRTETPELTVRQFQHPSLSSIHLSYDLF